MHRRPPRVFVVFTVFLLGAPLAGCDKQQPCSMGPAIQMDWTITDTAGNPQSCAQVGATDVNIYLDDVKQVPAFHCEAGTGVTKKLASGGPILVRAQLVTLVGQVLAQTDTSSVNVESCGITQIAPASFEVQPCTTPSFITLSWQITDSATATQLDCDQAGAAFVTVTVDQMPYQFPCNGYGGMTPELAPGTYQVSVSLVGSSNQVILQTQTQSITVGCSGVAVDLGTVQFMFN